MTETPDAAPAAGPVAWDDAVTRRAWRAYRTTGLRWLVAAAVCVLLVVAGGKLAVDTSAALLRDGVATTGTVTRVDSDEVTYSYDADGGILTETLEIVSGTDYAVGGPVPVRYDAEDPTVSRLVAEPRRIPGIGVAIVVLALVAAGTAVIGVGVLTRARRWRAALGRTSWRWSRLRIKGLDLAVTPAGGAPQVARLRSTSRWRTSTVQDLDGHELWTLADGVDLILRVDGVDTLFGARRRG